MELVGGLGDCGPPDVLQRRGVVRAAGETLAANSTAVVSLMCHNPYLAEVFQWHPKADRIHVLDFGFTTPFHPWENAEWRIEHGLPEGSPVPALCPLKSLRFYPSPEDEAVLSELEAKPYIILAATAGPAGQDDPTGNSRDPGGRSYRVRVQRGRGRPESVFPSASGPVTSRRPPGSSNLVDRLSVPGVAQAVKRAAGVMSADSAVLHMAWQEHRPVFLLYNHWTSRTLSRTARSATCRESTGPTPTTWSSPSSTRIRLARWLAARRAL